MSVQITYTDWAGFSRTNSYEPVAGFCVHCGKQGLWKSDAEDCECGPYYFCVDCGAEFTHQFEGISSDPIREHIVSVLREARESIRIGCL
jgi:hypothetical protein